MFVDQVKIHVQSGNGGAGCVSFRREKYVPRGGPNGGDGGRGGDVLFVAEAGPTTLAEFRYRRRYAAENGVSGGATQCSGADGASLVVKVPVGTLIVDDETGEILSDLTHDNQTWVAAHGGKGGLGNQHFATSTRQTPRYAQPGLPGESRELRLELKLLADVGLVGLPNAGKSTLISRVSGARPKVAAYPFTTLVPNLGVVEWGDFRSFVMADIPGLIEGAHLGRGLGTQFLRHVERTRCLLFMVDVTGMTEEAPAQALDILWNEIASHDMGLTERPYLVAATKIDAADPDALEAARAWAAARGVPFFAISSVAGDGLDALVSSLGELVSRHKPVHDESDAEAAENASYRQIWGEE
ncbi:MAG: GTPase ObgE [Nitrospirae bacterium]|nr:GTPase ObgE [Nitrospirota bacterium]